MIGDRDYMRRPVEYGDDGFPDFGDLTPSASWRELAEAVRDKAVALLRDASPADVPQLVAVVDAFHQLTVAASNALVLDKLAAAAGR